MDHPEFTPGGVSVVFDGEAVPVRTYVSPLFTMVASVFEVLLGWRRGVPEEWVKMIRSRASGLDLAPLLAFDGLHRTVPNFLLPLPPTPEPTIDEELAALEHTRVERIRDDLAGAFDGEVPEGYALFLTSTNASLDRLCETLRRYWDAALAPRWPQIKVVLQREVGSTGRELITRGTSAVLRSLPTRVSVRRGELHYPSPQQEDAEVRLGGRLLALVPMVCGPRGLITSEDRPDAVVIAYAARGVGAVWKQAGTGEGMALANLLGTTKARIVQAIAEPSTPSALAAQLELSLGTVSHHLNALGEQGLVQRERSGNAVYYSLNERGATLLDVFGR